MCSLLVIPMTINYIDPERYGIWLTISSIVGWIVFFDLGLGNGFRNHFVKARAANDTELCRKYVSTTYFSIAAVVCLVWLCAILINHFIDWSSVLNVSLAYRRELTQVVVIVLTFTSMNMVVNLFATLLTADLRPGLASVINAAGQWLVLLGILILKHTTEGSLTDLAFVYAGVPALTMTIISVAMFIFSRYKVYRPTPRLVERVLLRDIMGLGFKFFLIYLCMIAIFQIINMVISREVGSIGVTQYNIANKYFSVIFMVVSIIMQPIWSAVTDAYAKNDMPWLKNLLRQLNKIFILSIAGNIVFLIISPIAFNLWIGDSVQIPVSLSLAMVVYISCQTLGSIYVGIINGIGAVKVQCITYVIFGLIAWPLFSLAGRHFGLTGIVAVPAIVCLVQGLVCKYQIDIIMSGKAHGVWIK